MTFAASTHLFLSQPGWLALFVLRRLWWLDFKSEVAFVSGNWYGRTCWLSSQDNSFWYCDYLHVHSTLPYPALPNPVTSLYRPPIWRRCHDKHGAHVHGNAYAWSWARGRIYMHNVHVCMYTCTCMCFTLHSELRAYPSYRHPPRRRCPDKGGWVYQQCFFSCSLIIDVVLQ